MITKEMTRDERISSNMGLVYSCANRFKGRGIDYEDICGAGFIALIKAVDGFDEERGLQFSTYAVPVILGEMKRLFRDGGAIKVSRSLRELSIKISRERELFMKEHDREATLGELSERMGYGCEEIAEAALILSPIMSLTESEEDGGGQIDLYVPSYEESLGDTLSLAGAIADLPELDRRLIQLRYYGRKTQMQAGKILGLTQVTVSRKEKKILAVLRDKLM